MAFLDKKTRVLDVQLTELGRQLLAENQLRVVHYAFSDELIDYAGALSQSLAQSASMDDVVYKNFVPIECTSMGGKVDPDLRSFLYTCPEQRETLPPFTTDVSGALDLTRNYKVQSMTQFIAALGNPTPEQLNSDVVLVTERDDTKASDREDQYKAEQDLRMVSASSPSSLFNKR